MAGRSDAWTKGRTATPARTPAASARRTVLGDRAARRTNAPTRGLSQRVGSGARGRPTAEEQRAQRRSHRERDDHRGQHRHGEGDDGWPVERPGQAVDDEHGQHHDEHDRRRVAHGPTHLDDGVHDDRRGVLLAAVGTLPQTARDALDVDDRVLDHDADRQRQTREHQRVQVAAHEVEHEHGARGATIAVETSPTTAARSWSRKSRTISPTIASPRAIVTGSCHAPDPRTWQGGTDRCRPRCPRAPARVCSGPPRPPR